MSSGITGQLDYFNSLIGKQISNAYLIEDKIAVGGMGAVFRGKRLKEGDRVAIKVISPHLAANPVFVKRFQREARVGWALSHPNIVKVYEFGETDDGLLFMVMEFVEGETLSEYLERSGPLTVHRSLELLRPLCDALDTAHARTILHRDLKPPNIMIAKDEAGGEAIKLTDFGLAKLLQPDEEITQGSNLTEMGEACGTPFYMSPEQIIGQPLNPTSDIYSLGVILHQMLTAKMPIEGNSVRQVLALKINRDLAPPSAKFPFLPSTLDPVLQKVLARDPGKRYQTAGEFLQAYELAVSEITTEFSETTEPSIDRELLADVRSTLAQSPAARSYSESGPTGPLKAPVASYFESAPTGPLVAPPTSPSMPVASAPKLDASSPKQDPLPVAGSQTKLLLIIIGLLALIVIVLGILLFSQR